MKERIQLDMKALRRACAHSCPEKLVAQTASESVDAWRALNVNNKHGGETKTKNRGTGETSLKKMTDHRARRVVA